MTEQASEPQSGPEVDTDLTPKPTSSPSIPTTLHPTPFGSRSTSEWDESVCVSAPGKVLMAGGYLVLERKHQGLVLATSSRFYCVAMPVRERVDLDENSARITISAAQFPKECSWCYTVSLVTPSTDSAEPSTSTVPSPAIYLNLEQTNPEVGRNKFVEIAVAKTLHLALERITGEGEYAGDIRKAGQELIRRVRGRKGGLEGFVMADNDFYSQREQLSLRNLPRQMSSLAQLPPFNALPRPIHQINKTGLGSSAALTTSLISALLSYLRIISLPSARQSTSPTLEQTASLDTVHALSQLAHCLAQGKVGSGFDVSSAVYGSHSYRRFSPSILTPLMSTPHLPISPTGELSQALKRDRWDQEIHPLRLPRGFRLVLADVDAGTDTPSFVNKVLWWRAEKSSAEEAEMMWEKMDKANNLLRDHLEGMCAMEGDEGYDAFLEQCALTDMEHIDRDHPIGVQLYRIYSVLFCIRQLFRLITAASKVPVEPREQTRLLDACKKLPGVVGGGVPGAGGFDALYLLIIDQPQVLADVEDLWENWAEMSVCPLMARQSDGGLISVKSGEVRGLKQGIEGWRARIEGDTGIKGEGIVGEKCEKAAA